MQNTEELPFRQIAEEFSVTESKSIINDKQQCRAIAEQQDPGKNNLALLRTRLKFMKAEGRMMVTNRRVLFRAAGTSLTGNILQEHQFNLDERHR